MMRKLLRWMPLAYAAYLVLAVGLFAVLRSLGYRLTVSSPFVWFALSLAVEGAFAVLCFLYRKDTTKPAAYVSLLLPVLALAYVGDTESLEGVHAYLILGHSLLCFLSAFVVSLLYAQQRVLKHFATMVNSFLLYAVLLICASAVNLDDMVETSIVRRVPSPDQAYTAVLINVYDDAMGSSAHVQVRDNKGAIPLGYGRFEKSKELYLGEWTELRAVRLEWKDGHTLLINQQAYPVD